METIADSKTQPNHSCLVEESERTGHILEKAGLHNVCKWKKGLGIEDSPHIHEKGRKQKLICDNILDAVGFTPMVRINNITKAEGVKCEILAKCEFMNPGGSVKDRITRRMILDAEKTQKLKRGDVIIESTSGNTGIGLGIAAASLGYKLITTMHDKISKEKEMALKGLGAEVVRTSSQVHSYNKNSCIGTAFMLSQKLGKYYINQDSNPSNSVAHYDGLAQEIWDQCEGKVDVIVVISGTGGTMTGISRFFKDKDHPVKIVAMDAYGSKEAEPDEINATLSGKFLVEGLGADFIPRNVDRSCVDKWIKCTDLDGFTYARRLIKEEGLLVGGSSGCALWGALQEAKDLDEDKRIVIILPDSIRNYIK